MSMIYQRGTLYFCGKRQKNWYGKFAVYKTDEDGNEIREERNRKICPKAGVPKWEAQAKLDAMIAQANSRAVPTLPLIPPCIQSTTSPEGCTLAQAPDSIGTPADSNIRRASWAEQPRQPVLPNDAPTFRKFVNDFYIPKREGQWSVPYKKNNKYNLEHYLNSEFGDRALSVINDLDVQKWLDSFAEQNYSKSVVQQCFLNVRAIFRYAKKKNFILEDPTVELKMPVGIKAVKKLVMAPGQALSILQSITDLRDLALFSIGVFCGPRSSEAMGFQWKGWNGQSLTPHSIAYKGQFLEGELKSLASGAPIPVPEPVRPIIDAWMRCCGDCSPDALIFPVAGRGKRKGQLVPQSAESFLRGRIHPIATQLRIPTHLVNFRVMRRSLGTDLQHFGSLKDAQAILRHSRIATTGDIYQLPIEESVERASSLRASALLNGWTPQIGAHTAAALPITSAPKMLPSSSKEGGIRAIDSSNRDAQVSNATIAVPPRAVPLLLLRNNRARLYEEVWSTPIDKLAAKYGVSGVALGKACKRLGVPVPCRGDWAKIRAAIPVVRPPLLPLPPTE